MPRSIVSLFLVLAASVAAFSQTSSQTKWAVYDSPDGKYSVLLPSKPQLRKQDAKDADGKPLEQYMASAEEGNATMMIGYFDYFAPATFSFEKARDGLIRNIDGKLVTEENSMHGEYPGRSVVADAASAGIEFRVYVRFFDAGGRVYVVQYIVPKAEDGPAHKPRMAKYFDSFKITWKK